MSAFWLPLTVCLLGFGAAMRSSLSLRVSALLSKPRAKRSRITGPLCWHTPSRGKASRPPLTRNGILDDRGTAEHSRSEHSADRATRAWQKYVSRTDCTVGLFLSKSMWANLPCFLIGCSFRQSHLRPCGPVADVAGLEASRVREAAATVSQRAMSEEILALNAARTVSSCGNLISPHIPDALSTRITRQTGPALRSPIPSHPPCLLMPSYPIPPALPRGPWRFGSQWHGLSCRNHHRPPAHVAARDHTTLCSCAHSDGRKVNAWAVHARRRRE
jgi:hypothetical protein